VSTVSLLDPPRLLASFEGSWNDSTLVLVTAVVAVALTVPVDRTSCMVATVGLALTVPDFRRVDVDGGDEGERALLDDEGDGGAF
jgi:hypothetical protein